MDMATLGSTGIGRRQFLVGAAGVGAAAMLAGCSSSSSSESTDEETTTETAEATLEADFVVVGAGMAGFCAAIQAAQDGCENVVVLEKNSSVGGSTLFAEGVFGNDDSYQAEMGYGPYDLSEILEEEVDWSHGVINTGLFMDYMQASPEYIEWLLDLGVTFSTILDAGTGRYLLHIYEGGNGSSAIEVLSGVAEELGIQVYTDAPVTALLQEDGAVVGVQATIDGTLTDVSAPTVCLATGGVGSNADMMDEYTKLDAGKWTYLGNTGQDGDGITLAESTAHGRAKNVAAENMWIKVDGAGIYSTENFVAGMEGSNIWVNQDAERFCDESVAQNFYVANNMVHNQGVVYSLLDSTHAEYFVENGTTCYWSGSCPFMTPIEGVVDALDSAADSDSECIYKADTIAELAELIGLDADALQVTVDAWNADVAAGTDSTYGKDAAYMAAIETGPFYAGKLICGVLATIGGVRVNRAGQVTAPDGTPVEGLYAAGVVASGFSGEVYGVSAAGSNQGPAVYLGRLAGAAAAARA